MFLRSKRNRDRKFLERHFKGLVQIDSDPQRVSLTVPVLGTVFSVRAAGTRPFIISENQLRGDLVFQAADHVMRSGQQARVMEGFAP